MVYLFVCDVFLVHYCLYVVFIVSHSEYASNLNGLKLVEIRILLDRCWSAVGVKVISIHVLYIRCVIFYDVHITCFLLLCYLFTHLVYCNSLSTIIEDISYCIYIHLIIRSSQ